MQNLSKHQIPNKKFFLAYRYTNKFIINPKSLNYLKIEINIYPEANYCRQNERYMRENLKDNDFKRNV